MLRPLTYSLSWASRLTREAWGSIFTVPLKEEDMVEAVSRLKTHTHTLWLQNSVLPFLLSLQDGQLGLGVRDFQEDPKKPGM